MSERWIRHKENGTVHYWTKILGERKDMEEVVKDDNGNFVTLTEIQKIKREAKNVSRRKENRDFSSGE